MPILFNRYVSARNLGFCIGEGVLIFLSILVVSWLYKGTAIFLIDLAECIQQGLIVTMVFLLCLYYFDLYDLGMAITISETISRITQAFGFGCIVLAIVYYLLPAMQIPSMVFWSGYVILCTMIFLWRSAYYYILRRRMFVQNIVVIGTGKLASDISRAVEGVQDSVYRIAAFVGGDQPEFNPCQAPVVPSLEALGDVVELKDLQRIVVAPDDRRGTVPIQALVRYKLQGVSIEQGIGFYERATGKILAEKINPSWIFFSDGFNLSRWRWALKRMLDVSCSIFMMIFAFPVICIAALIIKFESAGPVFYLQERVGENNLVFKLIKLRSMRQDAEKDGPVWAAVQDDRVTRFGAFMRKTRIDELPQLWNVLKGDMSLVGPRPERPVFVEKLAEVIPFYDIRHATKPGVTGWAQVNYPYGASNEDALRKLEYDLYYLKNSNLFFDLFIIFKTIKTVLFRKGGR
jgi:sugar transferase (PEP-CTERM system associated)